MRLYATGMRSEMRFVSCMYYVTFGIHATFFIMEVSGDDIANSHYTRLNAIKNKAGAWEFTNKNREAATKFYEPEQKKATTDDLIIAASV